MTFCDGFESPVDVVRSCHRRLASINPGDPALGGSGCSRAVIIRLDFIPMISTRLIWALYLNYAAQPFIL
jgi:hypothetical protein